MVFRSKQDWWLTLILVGSSIALVAIPIWLAMLGVPGRTPLLGLAGAVLMIWLLLATDYTLTEDDLIIRSGPFKWTVHLADIEDIKSTRNPLSSPALSLDRLDIHYQQNGRRKRIMISPPSKPEFLQAIAKRAPSLVVERDSLRRRGSRPTSS